MLQDIDPGDAQHTSASYAPQFSGTTAQRTLLAGRILMEELVVRFRGYTWTPTASGVSMKFLTWRGSTSLQTSGKPGSLSRGMLLV